MKNRLLFIDGLRALAAIYVVMHHAMLQYYPATIPFKGMQYLSMEFFSYGHFAVNLFIILSGFCLMIPVMNTNYIISGGFWYFMKRRTIRILPTYYAALLVSLILIWTCIGDISGTHWDVSIPVTKNDIITHVLMIHDLFNSNLNKINHSFWSISVEYRIYIFFPFLIFIWRKYGMLATLVSSIFFGILGLAITRYFYMSGYKDLSFGSGVSVYIILFTIGLIAAYLSFTTGKFATLKTKIPWRLTFLFIIALFVLSYNHLGNSGLIGISLRDVLFATIVLCLLMQCVNSNSGLVKVLNWQPLVFLGSFSYSIYLLHAPLLQVIYKYLISPLGYSSYTSAILLIIFGSSICVALAYMFFIFFEKPFLNLGKKVSIKKTEINAAIKPAP